MKIDFVRHGKSENNGKGLVSGQTDVPLTDEGRKQVEDTALKISHDYSVIYSSDLIRCKQTAEIINNKLNLTIICDARLRERNFGSIEGKYWSDIPEGETIKWTDIKQQKYDYQPYGGENYEDVKERLFNFIADAKKEAGENSKILVVTHAGIIRIMHHVLKGKVPETIHNASVHEFEF